MSLSPCETSFQTMLSAQESQSLQQLSGQAMTVGTILANVDHAGISIICLLISHD